MPVKSLVDLASAACIKNIRQLDSVGDYLPYENVRHILQRVENAPQLRRIELNSPQLEGRTGEIWLKLIERDFPIEYRARAYKPQNPSRWHRVWEKYKRDHDVALEESASKLRSAFAGLREDKEKNTSKIVENKLLPNRGRIKGSRRGGALDRSALVFTSGSKTKMSNGADVMRRARREAKEIASIHGSLSRNTGAVNRARGLGHVSHAPKSMVNEHRIAAQPRVPSIKAAPAAPKVPSVVKEYEARATFISDSEDDEDDHDRYFDDDDEEEDYDGDNGDPFDEPKRAPARTFTKTRLSPELAPRPKAVARAQSPPRSLPKPKPSSSQPTSESPRKSGLAGRMAQKFGNPVRKTKPTTGLSKSAAAPKASMSPEKRAPTRASPPPRNSPPSFAPSRSSDSQPAAGAQPLPALPRKRKAVGVFMRPKKRLP